MAWQTYRNSMKINEKNIFLLDGLGALTSAFSTGVILPMFYQWTGVPASISLPLALLGLIFAIYSLSCFWFVKRVAGVVFIESKVYRRFIKSTHLKVL